tara:strand:+ start:401 stop:598 length:198 start_codon:yes stop_codon:yes gene_type:complete
MKNVIKILLSAVFLFAAVPTINAADMNMAGMEEVKKKKKKKGKKVGAKKGKKSKKGFFSKIFGSK